MLSETALWSLNYGDWLRSTGADTRSQAGRSNIGGAGKLLVKEEPPDFCRERKVLDGGPTGNHADLRRVEARIAGVGRTQAGMADDERSAVEHQLRTYINDAVKSGHYQENLGNEFTFDALQRQLVKDGYSAQAKNTKEVGSALTAAGVTQMRKSVEGREARLYVLPARQDGGPRS